MPLFPFGSALGGMFGMGVGGAFNPGWGSERQGRSVPLPYAPPQFAPGAPPQAGAPAMGQGPAYDESGIAQTPGGYLPPNGNTGIAGGGFASPMAMEEWRRRHGMPLQMGTPSPDAIQSTAPPWQIDPNIPGAASLPGGIMSTAPPWQTGGTQTGTMPWTRSPGFAPMPPMGGNMALMQFIQQMLRGGQRGGWPQQPQWPQQPVPGYGQQRPGLPTGASWTPQGQGGYTDPLHGWWHPDPQWGMFGHQGAPIPIMSNRR